MDSVLRPRDIQARIRAGETPEAVAAAAQTTVEKIIGFATPVLAERAYIAEQALKASVRRRAGDGPIGHLGEAVAARLEADDVDPGEVEWDAWRREDGRWSLVADYRGRDAQATRARFVYDVAGRYVVAEDEEAKRLVGERAPTRSEQLPLGEDAIEVVTGLRSVPDTPSEPERVERPLRIERPAEEATVDLTESVAAVPPAPKGEDWILTQASERPEAPERPDVPETLFEAPELEEAESAPDSEPARPRRPSRGKGRASVPSWDEIMFGSGKGE